VIAVTGASGLLGANLVMRLLARGEAVAALCHQHHFAPPGIQFVPLDLTDAAAVRAALEALRPSHVIHCAALTNVDRCETHPEDAQRLNVDATGHLAAAARAVDAGLTYISTDSVFPGDRGHYAETAPTGPVNNYARSKLAGEAVVAAASPTNLIVRTNLYGWNAQPKNSLAEWVLSRLEAGQPVPGFHDIFFNPLLATDLSDLLLDMQRAGLAGIYHAAGGPGQSKYAFAVALAEVFGYPPEQVQAVSAATVPSAAPRPRDTRLNTTKLRQALGRPLPDDGAALHAFHSQRTSGYAAQLKAHLRTTTHA
jgi:dTDP-4-dehydrorhamnose reductase